MQPHQKMDPPEGSQETSATCYGTAHPNILNLLSCEEVARGSLPSSTSSSSSSKHHHTVTNGFTATSNPLYSMATKLLPNNVMPSGKRQLVPVAVDPNYSFLSAYQRPAQPIPPVFKRPCSEATLAKLKSKFTKTTTTTNPSHYFTTPLPEYDTFQSSILKGILLGNLPSKPESNRSFSTQKPNFISKTIQNYKVTPQVITIDDDDDDDIRLLSESPRISKDFNNNNNNQKISNQNRSSVICKIPSSVTNGTLNQPKKPETKIIVPEVSGKTFIDSIFKSIMNSVAEINAPDEPKEHKEPKVPKEPEPKAQPPSLPNTQTPKPIFIEPKSSPSCASALSQLLQTRNEPKTTFSKPTSSRNCLEGTTNRVYQQMIEFEFNHEFIVKKFKDPALIGTTTSSSTASFGSSYASRLELNHLERSRIDELTSILTVLHSRCLFEHPVPGSTETQTSCSSTNSPLTKTQSVINLLVTTTESLSTFANLTSFDRLNLLSGNIIEMLLLRSLLIKPNCITEQFAEKETLDDLLDEDEDEAEGLVIEEESDEVRQFRSLYRKLALSIDKNWCKDKTIFNLVFAILLFRTSKHQNIIVDRDKIRDEHLSYVYLLKRHLEQKFRSFCTARSHFIRIFDHLEELHAAKEELVSQSWTEDSSVLDKFCFC